MKKNLSFILAASLFLTFTGCSKETQNSSETESAPYYSSVSDVTLAKIIDRTKPVNMVEYKGGFKQTLDYSGFGDDNVDNAEIYLCYKKTDDIIEINQVANYPDNYFNFIYMSNDKDDPHVYNQSPVGCTTDKFTDSDFQTMFENTVLGYSDLEAELGDVKEEGGKYIATVKISTEGTEAGADTITIDPETGLVLSVKSSDNSSGQEISVISEFTYSSDIKIDRTPKENAAETEEQTEESSTEN